MARLLRRNTSACLILLHVALAMYGPVHHGRPCVPMPDEAGVAAPRLALATAEADSDSDCPVCHYLAQGRPFVEPPRPFGLVEPASVAIVDRPAEAVPPSRPALRPSRAPPLVDRI